MHIINKLENTSMPQRLALANSKKLSHKMKRKAVRQRPSVQAKTGLQSHT